MDSPNSAPRGETSGESRKTLRITLVRSPLGNTVRHKATVRALGLRRLHQTVEQADTPQVRGMLARVAHLVAVEEAE
jgi:large subunit ribosomal protein L30